MDIQILHDASFHLVLPKIGLSVKADFMLNDLAIGKVAHHWIENYGELHIIRHTHNLFLFVAQYDDALSNQHINIQYGDTSVFRTVREVVDYVVNKKEPHENKKE